MDRPRDECEPGLSDRDHRRRSGERGGCRCDSRFSACRHLASALQSCCERRAVYFAVCEQGRRTLGSGNPRFMLRIGVHPSLARAKFHGTRFKDRPVEKDKVAIAKLLSSMG